MVYLQITLKVSDANRSAATDVYRQYRSPFLNTVSGARSKELLVRAEDVQVLIGFDTEANASAYLQSDLFTVDVASALKPLLDAAPDARIYRAA